MTSELQHHIRCSVGDIAPSVLLPGDPARAEVIGSMLDGSTRIAVNREYTTFTGTWNGVPVSVTSTGIGCPSAAIAVEELARCGARQLVRVGTSGSMQPGVGPGDLVVGTGAIRDEGTSRAYLPIEFPAVADHILAGALATSARQSQRRTHLGVIHSKDSFYGQKEPQNMPVADELTARWSAWQAGGALCSEMETAAIFTVATVRAIRAGSICLVASSLDGSSRLGGKELEKGVIELSTVALNAIAADAETNDPT